MILAVWGGSLRALPTFNITTQCAGSQSSFALSNTNGIDSAYWDFGNGNTSPMMYNAPFATINLYSNSGSYTVSISYYINGVPNLKDTTIIILGTPTPSLYDFNQCYEPITYNATSLNATYLWSTGATTPTINISTSGTYWVKVTNQCGTGTDTGVVAFIYPPSQTMPIQIDLCGDTSVALIAGPLTDNYLWQDGSTNNYYIVSEPIQLSVYVNNQCGSAYEYTTVNYYAYPYLNLGPDTILCNQSSYELKAPFKPATTVWYDGSTDTVKLITQPGTYYVKVSNFCKTLYDTVTIDFQNTPHIDLGNDTTICGGQSVTWYVYNYGANYNWSNGSTVDWAGTYQPGNYWVTVENACGTVSDTVRVKMRFIYLHIPTSDTNICVNDYLPVNVAVDSTTSYLWSDGNTNSYRDLTKPGHYVVTVSNECGTLTDSIRISMYDCNYCAKFPSGFTPNNDGKNDLFHVLTDCDIRDFNLNIYNRMGGLIFSTNNKDIGWDGTYHGAAQPIGVYVYQVTYKFWDGDSLVESYGHGQVTLIR